MAKKLLKNLLVRYSISFEIFSASVYSLKDFIVYFSMYFSLFLLRNELHYTIPCFVCQDFFWHFFIFLFGQNKKLVTLFSCLILLCIIITNSLVNFYYFVCCKVLIYNSIFIFLCQYFFSIFFMFFCGKFWHKIYNLICSKIILTSFCFHVNTFF